MILNRGMSTPMDAALHISPSLHQVAALALGTKFCWAENWKVFKNLGLHKKRLFALDDQERSIFRKSSPSFSIFTKPSKNCLVTPDKQNPRKVTRLSYLSESEEQRLPVDMNQGLMYNCGLEILNFRMSTTVDDLRYFFADVSSFIKKSAINYCTRHIGELAPWFWWKF